MEKTELGGLALLVGLVIGVVLIVTTLEPLAKLEDKYIWKK